MPRAKTPTAPPAAPAVARWVETIDIPIADLTPYPGNARTHDDAALDESAATNGQYRSVVARRIPGGTVQILAGHGTIAAFGRAGATTARVEVIDADDAQARRIVLADNGTSRNAGYDDGLLLALLDDASRDGGLTGTGWDTQSYRELLDAAGDLFDPGAAGDADDQDVEPPEDPVTQVGDVWLLGEHRLVCGDATSDAAWTALLERGGARIDCVWTDPPYGVTYVGKTKDALTIENDDLDEGALRALVDGALGRALAATRPGAAWYLAAPPGPLNLIFGTWLHEVGVYRQQLIWVKDQFVMGRSDYHYRHEPIFYGWTPGAAHHALDDRTQDTVWEIPRPKRSVEHPTMKPIDLVIRALHNSTDPGALVADPFAGSGTTILACQVTGRRGRAIELSPGYCDVIARRWQDIAGEMPVLERTGVAHDFTAVPAHASS